MIKKIKSGKKLILSLIIIIVLGFIIPENFKMPVEEADTSSYNKNSFWYYPWGKSGTHKGVDIFAKSKTPIRSSTSGLVLFCGEIKRGGKVVLILGPKWRIHYYAHLNDVSTSVFSFAGHHQKIGTVGTTGNARGKPPHLHYSIITIIPFIWNIDSDSQGWKKMFYIDPVKKLNKKSSY